MYIVFSLMMVTSNHLEFNVQNLVDNKCTQEFFLCTYFYIT